MTNMSCLFLCFDLNYQALFKQAVFVSLCVEVLLTLVVTAPNTVLSFVLTEFLCVPRFVFSFHIVPGFDIVFLDETMYTWI